MVKEQYCIGTWNVRSMNQGKLEVVKEEMARVNIDILGINELKWTRMGEFNSDDFYIYYCWEKSLQINVVALIVNFSFFSITGWGIDLNYCDIEWFALETNRDHSVIFEIAPKYCISDSFVDYKGYYIYLKGFFPTIVNVKVI